MGDLQVNGLVKHLGNNLVVNNVSFHVGDGEFFVLLGPSGGGKSTLLRLISGLEMPEAGTIAVNGRDITRLPPRERNLGMVFQDYGLYPNMDVFGNIAYGLEARRMDRAEIARRIVAAAEKLGLTPHLRRSITDLSGGEQQRVALARALVKDADAYLFDEPLSNLDPKLRYQARKDIIALHREKKQPSVYVTHDQSEAFAMADRIGVMGRGNLQQVGTPDEILHEPANIFMATFIGPPNMNLIGGHLAGNGGGYQVVADDVVVNLPPRWKPTLDRYGKDRVVLGIRPEAIAPATGAAEWAIGPENTLVAHVEDVEPLIGETMVTLRFGRGTSVMAVFPDTGDELPVAGQNLAVGVDLDRLRLFDPDTEHALVLV